LRAMRRPLDRYLRRRPQGVARLSAALTTPYTALSLRPRGLVGRWGGRWPVRPHAGSSGGLPPGLVGARLRATRRPLDRYLRRRPQGVARSSAALTTPYAALPARFCGLHRMCWRPWPVRPQAGSYVGRTHRLVGARLRATRRPLDRYLRCRPQGVARSSAALTTPYAALPARFCGLRRMCRRPWPVRPQAGSYVGRTHGLVGARLRATRRPNARASLWGYLRRSPRFSDRILNIRPISALGVQLT
jgi:hypothetical protein